MQKLIKFIVYKIKLQFWKAGEIYRWYKFDREMGRECAWLYIASRKRNKMYGVKVDDRNLQ